MLFIENITNKSHVYIVLELRNPQNFR